MRHFLVVLAVLSFSAQASAAVIDFGDTSENISGASWAGEVDGVGLTLQAAPEGAQLQQTAFGLGVRHDDDWLGGIQIEGQEILTVTFDELQSVSGFTVTNLYETPGFGFLIRGRDETGAYTIDGNQYLFDADSITGVLQVDFSDEFGGPVSLQSITFTAVDSYNSIFANGFTLKSITTAGAVATSVSNAPELDPGAMPGAVALLVGSALVLNARRRQRA